QSSGLFGAAQGIMNSTHSCFLPTWSDIVHIATKTATDLLTWLAGSDLADVVIHYRARHYHRRGKARRSPAEPCQPPPPAHHEVVFKQRNAAQDCHLRVSSHVLQIFERSILHLADTRDA